MNNESLVLFFIVAVALVGLAVGFSMIIPPKSSNAVKSEPYECGIETKGTTWVQFNVGYYLFAIVYLVFDVETVFIFPWAVVMKTVGIRAFVEILIFFFILGLGLVYAWKKGALKWE
ncbi:MAG: NADH-quinone oxidoreductase subunit A [Bacteroidota bacterium]